MWAADQSKQLNPTGNFTLLDATIFWDMQWATPKFTMNKNETFILQFGYSRINAKCGNINNYQSLGFWNQSEMETMIDFEFNNATAFSNITLNNQTQIYVQIFDFNVESVKKFIFFKNINTAFCVCVCFFVLFFLFFFFFFFFLFFFF